MQLTEKRLAARRIPAVVVILPQGHATTQMTASRLAQRERPKLANSALQSLERACHSLRTAPCLDQFRALCIPSYHLARVLTALTGFLTSMLPVDINTKKGMMDELCGFAHHVLEDSLPAPASAATAPSNEAFGIWKPE